MIGPLKQLTDIVCSKPSVKITFPIMDIYSTWTFSFFSVAFILITTNALVGEPINCSGGQTNPHPSPTIINNYCYIQSTHTMRRMDVPNIMDTQGYTKTTKTVYPFGNFKPKNAPWDEIYPGVFPESTGDEKIVHNYYKFVPVVLLLQAMTFLIGYTAWSKKEGGKLAYMIQDLNNHGTCFGKKRDMQLQACVELLLSEKHRLYVFWYYQAEVLNLFVCILNFIFNHFFLNKEFIEYGYNVILFYKGEIQQDPMDRIFPMMTKCTYNQFGPSGTVESRDFICSLAVNKYLDKIYLYLWFWMILVSTLSILSFFLTATNIILHKCYYKSQLPWSHDFVMKMLKQNINPITYRKIMKDLLQEIKKMGHDIEGEDSKRNEDPQKKNAVTI